MRFLGTQDISLRAEKDALEQNIQKAGMSGAEKRDPQSVAKMRQRLAEIYTRLDPAKAVKEQVKANQGTRFNPAMGDYDPLNMNLQTAMALVDRKYGNQPGYLKSRDQVKYSIQNQLSGGTPIDSASVVGRARDELTKATKKDPGGAKAATLESRRNLVDAQKTKASDLEGMTNPYDIAMTLMDLQNQGGMDRPIGGGMANRPNISPYGNSLPAQAMAAAGMVTDQMRPSESIPSTQKILGKEKGVQVDAFIKSLGSMFDPAQLATPLTGAADMADMAFRALDPVARQQVEKELKGATKEEQDTFLARMLGMLTGGVIQGKMGHFVSSKFKGISERPLPPNLESVLNDIAPKPTSQRNFLPEIATKTNPDQIGLAQAASMKRPAKPRVEPVAKPADFTVGQEIKVPKKNGSEVAAKVTDVTDVSVGIETAAGVKKFYSPEDAKAILKPRTPNIVTVYHGTGAPFEGKPTKSGSRTGAIHYTTDREFAQNFANRSSDDTGGVSRLIETKIDLSKVADMSDPVVAKGIQKAFEEKYGTRYDDDQMQTIFDGDVSRELDPEGYGRHGVYGENWAVDLTRGMIERADFEMAESATAKEWARANGYIGVKAMEDGIPTFALLDENVISDFSINPVLKPQDQPVQAKATPMAPEPVVAKAAPEAAPKTPDTTPDQSAQALSRKERIDALLDEQEAFVLDGTPENRAKFEEIGNKIRDITQEQFNTPPPDVTPPAQPKRRNPKQPRQAGKTDLKALGAVGGATLAGAAVYFKNDIQQAIEDNNLEDIRNTLVKAGVGAAIVSVALNKGKGMAIPLMTEGFDPFRVLLDPRSVEKLSKPGAFKTGLADVLSVNDLYKLKTARAMANIEQAGKKAFGEKPQNSPIYKEWNTKFRDHVEQNIANGKNWEDGVPPEFVKFAQASIKEMDGMLDQWEKLGGRISVVNDGVQQAKMQVGASLKLATGEWAEYVGFKKLKNGDVKLQVEVVNAAGKKVIRDIAPGEDFGRPVYRIGEAYVPRVYTRAFIDQIIKGGDDFKAALNQAAVKAGGQPLTDTEFASLKDFARGFDESSSATNVNSFMGNLQKERQLQFAKFEYTDASGKKIVVDPYENSYFDAVRKYTDKASKRLAVAETLGVDSDVLAQVIDGVSRVDYHGGKYLTDLVGNLLDLGPATPNRRVWWNRAFVGEGRYQAITKLLGGTSAISQFSDIIIPLTEFGPATVGRAIQKLVKDPTFKADIDAFNGGTQAWLKEMSGIEYTGSKAELASAKIVDVGMTVVLLKQMDKTMKRINTASVVTQVEQIGKKIEAKQKLTGPETRMVDRLGMTKWVDDIKNNGLDATMAKEKFQSEIAGHAKTFQYSGAVEDMPLWMSTPVGAVVMRFKKPWYVATKTLMQGAMNEATHGNYTPLARLTAYSVTVGAGAQYMKDIIKMSGLDDETRELFSAGNYGEAIKRMFVDVPLEKNYLAKGLRDIREDKSGALMQLIGLVGQTMYESGATGIAGEVTPLNQRSQSDIRQFDAWNAFKPIGVQSVQRIVGMGVKAFDATFGMADPKKAWADNYETLRSEVIPTRRVFDFLNAKPDEVRRREGERKIKRENATVDKDMPESMRREQQKYKAYGEKIQRKIINSATPKF